MVNVLQKISEIKIIPVVTINDAQDTQPLCRALVAGGLPCAEITFRTDAAAEAIKIASQNPDMLVGAGTVLKIEQAQRAVDAGAQFLVSPGFNPKVVGYCVDNNITIIPGISTATDIEMALEFEITTVKFFPAEAFGGLKMIKALSGPYGMIKFMPTSGINAANVKDYLAFPKVIACGGSWMVKSDLITSGNFDEIEKLTKEAAGMV